MAWLGTRASLSSALTARGVSPWPRQSITWVGNFAVPTKMLEPDATVQRNYYASSSYSTPQKPLPAVLWQKPPAIHFEQTVGSKGTKVIIGCPVKYKKFFLGVPNLWLG